MEGFLEANEVVEISLSKLANIKRAGDLPLRKTLMVSRVLSRAQELASSAQDSLLSNHMNSSRCSSKLLASFASNQSNASEDGLPSSCPTMRCHSREQSPIATEEYFVAPQPPDQEPMDLENVSSLLGTILEDMDSLNQQHRSPLREIYTQDNFDTRTTCPGDLSDVCATSDSVSLVSRPVSPGKRNYQEAFPFVVEQSRPSHHDSVDLKRFKACTEDAFTLDSLPGCCGYLSTKNLQTAPFITYMFGKGFTYPSNSNSFNNWPSEGRHNEKDSSTSASPILAF